MPNRWHASIFITWYLIMKSDKQWRQRLKSFNNALDRLDEACQLDSYSFLELSGLVKHFEITYELGWKLLKLQLSRKGVDVNTPRDIIREGFVAGYYDTVDCKILLEALDKRNKLVLVYNAKIAKNAEFLIKQSYHPVLVRLRDVLEQVKDA